MSSLRRSYLSRINWRRAFSLSFISCAASVSVTIPSTIESMSSFDMSRSLRADSFCCSSVIEPNTAADCGFMLGSRNVSSSLTSLPNKDPLGLPIARNKSAPPGSTRTGLPLPSDITLSNPKPATSQFPSHASTAKPSCNLARYSGLFNCSCRSCFDPIMSGENVILTPSSPLPIPMSAASTFRSL